MDPVTNSQDPDVKAFRVAAEKQGADKATVAVTIESHQRDSRANLADKTIRYDFVHEAGPMENRRHQGRRRRQPVVGPRPARRFIQVLGFASIRICK
jgi:hypothetical protein